LLLFSIIILTLFSGFYSKKLKPISKFTIVIIFLYPWVIAFISELFSHLTIKFMSILKSIILVIITYIFIELVKININKID
jgi:hypothetical protein